MSGAITCQGQIVVRGDNVSEAITFQGQIGVRGDNVSGAVRYPGLAIKLHDKFKVKTSAKFIFNVLERKC